MKPVYEPQAEQYREKVQAFLAEKLPSTWKGIGSLEGNDLVEFMKQWRQVLASSPYLAPGWPVEYGGGDGGLHERTPYWLNGIVPLAFLLSNANVTLNPVVGVYKAASPNSRVALNASRTANAKVDCGHMFPSIHDDHKAWAQHGDHKHPLLDVDLLAQVECYIGYILDHQSPEGWLGPDDATDAGAPWGRAYVLLSLAMYAEAKPEAAARVQAAMLQYNLCLYERLQKMPLVSWAQQRWQEMALSVVWLLDRGAAGEHEETMLTLLRLLHTQGSDWEAWFEMGTFPSQAGVRGANNHNVNNAQALKSAAVLYRFTTNASLATLSRTRVEKLDAHCGLPTGMFVGDELIDATHSPSRGIELCGVVEAMYSYTVMFGTFGEVSTLDRAERIAYNALPATWASPKGGDMWAHQYLQAVNQIEAKYNDPHVWTHDGPDAERYGLEPNYGCCTANFNQGWPKFAQNIFWLTPDGGVAVGLLAPAAVTLPPSAGLGHSEISVDTEYPFGDDVTISAKADTAPFPVYVRVPAWASGQGAAAILIEGQPSRDVSALNGTLVVAFVAPVGKTLVATLRLKPALRIEEWAKSGYSVHRGPLMYSLQIAANFTAIAHHYGDDDMSNDYDTDAASPWRFALVANSDDPSATLSFEQRTLTKGAAPFNHSGFPVVVHATVRSLPSWGIVTNAAAEPPASPACASGSCGAPQSVELVPFGSTDLRIGQFPLA